MPLRLSFFIVFLRLFALNSVFCDNKRPVFVMINPAGHAKNVGRKLPFGDYERSVTFEFAKTLQKELQEKYGVRVILTRFIGEEILDPLQNTSFANRLSVDFYLSLHFYANDQAKPKMFMYHLVYNPLIDLAHRIFDPLSFVLLNEAHYKNINRTIFLGEQMKNVLTKTENQKRFDFYGLFGIPIRPLVGLVAPSITIEIGIRDEYQWKSLIDPIVDSLNFLRDDDE